MVINLLHTIAITCALGTNLNMGRNNSKPTPNRTNQEYQTQSLLFMNQTTINLGTRQDTVVYETEEETIESTNRLYKGQITGQRIYGETIKLNTYGFYENRSDETPNYSGDIYETTTPSYPNPRHYVEWKLTDNPTNTWTDRFYPTMNLYIFKINTQGTAVNATIDIVNNIGYLDNMYAERFYNWTNIQNSTKKLYLDYFTTNSKELSSLFTTNNTESIIKNKNAYDTYESLMYKAGYTSNRNIKTQNLTIIQDERWDDVQEDYVEDNLYREEIHEPITLYPTESTYVIMFTQTYVYQNTLSENVGEIAINIDNDSATGMSAQINGTIVINSTNTEIVDIPGTMIYILGMPFTFISTAFNITIFPGTPYQVNLSTLFLSIIAVLVFVFLLKIILNAVGNK